MLKQTGKPLFIFLGFSLLVEFWHYRGHPLSLLVIPALPLSMIGTALGIFLSFRNNNAYDRWWEARTLWGALVNHSRSWARQIISFTRAAEDPPQDERNHFVREMVYWQLGFVHSLRFHLREEDGSSAIARFLPPDAMATLQGERNVPVAILQEMAVRVVEARERGVLSEVRLFALNQTLNELTNIQGACERIRNTPLPRQYDYYPELFVYLYCFLLPLSLTGDLGIFAPAVTLILGFVFLVLNRIGKNLEDPFHSLVYGVPMMSLCRTIEINLLQQLGEREIPSPTVPIEGVLT